MVFARKPVDAKEYCGMMRSGVRELRRLLYFVRKTGCRTCEARELVWSDVRLDAAVPCVILASGQLVKKTRTARSFPLDASMARFLRNLKRCRQSRTGADHVFVNRLGRPWTRRTLCNSLRRLRRLAGLPTNVENRLNACGLRYLFCIQTLKAGMPSSQIAAMLGHNSTQMVDRARQRMARLSRGQDDAKRLRLREQPAPIKKPDSTGSRLRTQRDSI
jgi:integrase